MLVVALSNLLVLIIFSISTIDCGSLRDSQSRHTRALQSGDANAGNANALPTRDQCGFQDNNKILGGSTTDYAEFPWMALLLYNRHSGGMTFACGGALINHRYVLTAAHCVTGDITKTVGELVGVRLGEWNTETAQDCDTSQGFKDCNDPHVDVDIEYSTVHAKYQETSKNRYHDIALIRMVRAVRVTEFIKPICLPTQTERAPNGAQLWVSGWGRTENSSYSSVKLKVSVPIVGKSQCSNTFRSLGITIADSQLCAGGLENRDSCSGDSGGPLMVETTKEPKQWIVEGIVSFGTRCGTQNWPGIYTRVSEYVNWIQQNMEP